MMSFPQAMDAEVEEHSTHCDGLTCAKPQKRVFAETLTGDVSSRGQEKAAKRLCSDDSEQGYGSLNSEVDEASGCAGMGNTASSIVPRMQLCALEETSENTIITTSHCSRCLAGDPGHLQHMMDSDSQALMDTS